MPRKAQKLCVELTISKVV